MRFPDARILIFAKAPQPGQVNTRLIPLLGAESAAAFHAACVRYMVSRRARAGLAPVMLYTAPDTQHPLFAELSTRLPVTLWPQVGGDLGERMANAASAALQQAQQVVLTGTDAPCLDNQQIAQAIQLLDQAQAPVMVPASDGGYVLLGLGRQSLPAGRELFTDMPWGSAQVAQQTRVRCRQAGMALRELPECDDVDRPADLLRLAGAAGLPAEIKTWDAQRWLGWLQALRC